MKVLFIKNKGEEPSLQKKTIKEYEGERQGKKAKNKPKGGKK
jgi:hypothetical protein